MRSFGVLSVLFLLGLNSSIAQDDYSLFFTDQYQNPAISSHLKSHYFNFQGAKKGANLTFEHYEFTTSANVSIPSIQSNMGVFYQNQDLPSYLSKELGMNLGHRFKLTDSSSLNVGLNALWAQHQERFVWLNNLDFSSGWHSYQELAHGTYQEPEKEEAFTENAGLFYQSPQYYAGLSVRNFLVASNNKALFEESTYPHSIGINGIIARHFLWNDFKVSPTIYYRGEGTKSMSHWFWAGINAKFQDKYTLGFKTRTSNFKSHAPSIIYQYQAQVGAEFWDSILIRIQARFPRHKFSPNYNDESIAFGAGVSWFIGKDF